MVIQGQHDLCDDTDGFYLENITIYILVLYHSIFLQNVTIEEDQLRVQGSLCVIFLQLHMNL
jgi:hypothetical protein